MPAVDELAVQIAAVNRASAELNKIARDIVKVDQAARNTRGLDSFNRAFSGLGGFARDFKRDAGQIALGVISAQAAIGGLRGAFTGTIGAAISFESSFAGIRKTVDATEAEFARLAETNRQMARSIPVSADSINQIGELAGQLGVTGVDNIAKFERVIADLSNTTDLSAETAATAFAQIANVLELPIANVDRLGAAIVDLGNKGAATESGIVDFTQRIAGAGKIAGLQAAEIAGIGSAFASVGIEAEAGGTAIQKVLIEMTKAATQGGDALDVFAETTGLTVAKFQELAKSNPAEAFVQFVEGLGRAGDRAFDILEDLELGDQRLIRSFLSAAGAGNLLRESIETGSDAFRANTALQVEAEKRYATTAASLQILKNNAIDVGISIGDELLPALGKSASGANELIDAARPMGPTLKIAAEAAVVLAAGLAAVKFVQFSAGAVQAAASAASLRAVMLGTGAASIGTAPPLIALTAGVVGLDLAMRQFKGESLLDFMTGAKDRAAAATREQLILNRELEQFNYLVENSPGGESGALRSTADQLVEVQQRIDGLTAKRKELAKVDQDGTHGLVDTVKALRLEEDRRDALVEIIEKQGLSYVELKLLVAQHPGLHDILSDALEREEAVWRAMVPTTQEVVAAYTALETPVVMLTGREQELTDAASGAAAAHDELTKAVKAVQDAFDIRTAAEITLDRQIAEAEALIAAYEAAGTEVPADLKVMHDQLLRNRDAATAMTGAAIANFEEMRKVIEDTGGASGKALDELTAQINGLPEAQRIEVITELNKAGVDEVNQMLEIMRSQKVTIEVALSIRQQERAALDALRRGEYVPTGALPTGRAMGGIVRRPELALIGEDGPEAVLPLSKPGRMQQILSQLGIPSHGDGAVPSFLDLARGTAQLGSGAGGGAASGGLVEASANEFAELAEAIAAAGESSVSFIAKLELWQEQQAAVAEAQRVIDETAVRSAIDLTKLAVVLGDAGVSGEAFVLSQFLGDVGANFRQAGVAVDDGMLAILSATGDFSAQMIEFAARVQAAAARHGADVQVSTHYTNSQGERVSDEEYERAHREGRGGEYDRHTEYRRVPRKKTPLEEGLERIGGAPSYASGTDYVPKTGPAMLHRGEAVLTADENARRGGDTNYYGPVSNSYYGGREARETSFGLR